MDREFWLPAGGVALLVLGVIWLAVVSDRRERELIDSGACHVDVSALYQPPPTMVCTARDSNGGCIVMTPITSDPYMRDHWRCEGGQQFWRRQP